ISFDDRCQLSRARRDVHLARRAFGDERVQRTPCTGRSRSCRGAAGRVVGVRERPARALAGSSGKSANLPTQGFRLQSRWPLFTPAVSAVFVQRSRNVSSGLTVVRSACPPDANLWPCATMPFAFV